MVVVFFFEKNSKQNIVVLQKLSTQNRCLTLLTRPSYVSLLLRLFFSTQHTQAHTYRMEKDNDTCVFILSSLPIRQQASHTACSKHSFSRSFCAFTAAYSYSLLLRVLLRLRLSHTHTAPCFLL